MSQDNSHKREFIGRHINSIIQGDVLEVLKTFPDEVIDFIITSPPYYGLRRYGDYKEQIGLEKTFDCEKQGLMRLRIGLTEKEITYILQELDYYDDKNDKE